MVVQGNLFSLDNVVWFLKSASFRPLVPMGALSLALHFDFFPFFFMVRTFVFPISSQFFSVYPDAKLTTFRTFAETAVRFCFP